MAHQVTYGESRLPQACGDITRYDSWCGSTSRQCIYVNGILNSDADHESSCKALSRLTAASVLGVFNKSGLISTSDKSLLLKLLFGDIAIDLGECALDWSSIVPSATLGWPGATMTFNKSVIALFYLLRLTGNSWPMNPIVIVAHSQGNLVAANALFLYAYLVKKHQLKQPNIHVVGIASPAPSWPTNDYISVKLFTHAFDIVPYLSLGRSGVGGPSSVPYVMPADVTISENSASHGVDTYLDDESVVEWLWSVLKTPEPVKKVIRKEMEEAKKKQAAEAAARKKIAAESMARFNKFSDLGPKY
jgi:hypothetical protein